MLSVHVLVMYPYLICDGAHNKALVCGPFSFSHGTVNGAKGSQEIFFNTVRLRCIGSDDGRAAPDQGRGIEY